MEPRPIVVFADGAAKGNPGPGGWGALILSSDGHVTELGSAIAHTTNNRMELTAVIEALRALGSAPGCVQVYTDSSYVIQGITRWIHNWKRRGWKTAEGGAVLNRGLWEDLDRLVGSRGQGHPIGWHHVRGHSGIAGNERVDAIADAFASGCLPALYDGPECNYTIPLFPLPEADGPPRANRPRSGTRGQKPYSYLSLVDGKVMRHATWTECEQRVKGRSGARFKKAMSAAEEVEILRVWGCQDSQ